MKKTLLKVIINASSDARLCEELLEANKAVQRVSVQFERVYLLREGVSRRTDTFLPDEEKKLDKLVNRAISKLLPLNKEFRIFERFYNLKDKDEKLTLCLDMACQFDNAVWEINELSK